MVNAESSEVQGQSNLHDEQPQGHPSPEAHGHHEGLDLNLHVIFSVGVILLALVVVIQCTLWWMMKRFAANPDKPQVILSPLADIPRTPPPPRQQLAPPLDEQAFRAAEDRALNSYGWVDKPSGVVHIPVERARELILQQGMPAPEGQP